MGARSERCQDKNCRFRKRGPTKDTEVWFYKSEKLEIVQDFNYLGVIFNFTGSFTLHNQYVIGKALRASRYF